MYYEECIKNGVLCYRLTPDGEWQQKTQEQLTEMLLEARRKVAQPPISTPVAPCQNQPIFYQPVFLPQPTLQPYVVTC